MSEFKVGDIIYFQGDQGKVMKVTHDGNEPLLEVALTSTRVAYLNPSQLDLYPLSEQLNENQQIVLDYLKTRFGKRRILVKSVFVPSNDLLSGAWNDDVDIALERLDLKQEIQVLEVFSQWALEQEK